MAVASSTSSLLGYPGQSNYCAANAYLDQAAAWGDSTAGIGRGEELPLVCLNFGPWGEVGMAAAGTKAHALAVAEGDTPLPSAAALSAIGRALARAAEEPPLALQYAICDVDWRRSKFWSAASAAKNLRRGMSPSVTVAAQPAAAAAVGGGAGAAATGAATGAAAGGGAVEDFILTVVSKYDEEESLSALGLDSLDLVQLRNNFVSTFGIKVPLSAFAAHKTLGELVEELQALLTK